jgi:hypothetical protein
MALSAPNDVNPLISELLFNINLRAFEKILSAVSSASSIKSTIPKTIRRYE